MNGPVWLVILLTIGLAGVLWWSVADWRRDGRQAKTAGRAALAAIAEMGRHNHPGSAERTNPKFAEAREMLPLGDEPLKRPRSVPVHVLVARLRGEGHALRLNWRHEDEQRAQSDDTWSAGDFPTAELPAVQNEEP